MKIPPLQREPLFRQLRNRVETKDRSLEVRSRRVIKLPGIDANLKDRALPISSIPMPTTIS